MAIENVLAEYEPWKYSVRKKDMIDCNTFRMFEINKAIAVVIRLLKGYLKNYINIFDTAQVVVNFMLELNSNYSSKFMTSNEY